MHSTSSKRFVGKMWKLMINIVEHVVTKQFTSHAALNSLFPKGNPRTANFIPLSRQSTMTSFVLLTEAKSLV